MLKKKFIVWILACVALLIIAMPAIPHHHHSDRYTICLTDGELAMDSTEMCYCVTGNCEHDHMADDKSECDITCPTHIHAIKSSSDDHLLFEQVTLQLFNIQISEFVILYLSGNKDFDREKSIHVEKFYATPTVDIRDGRAPPYFNA